MALLHVDKLTIHYPQQRQPALRNVSLVLESGDRLALVGPSGCGKSTLARAILGLLPQGSSGDGVLQVAGRDPRHLPPQHLRQHRGSTVGLVFPGPDDAAQSRCSPPGITCLTCWLLIGPTGHVAGTAKKPGIFWSRWTCPADAWINILTNSVAACGSAWALP